MALDEKQQNRTIFFKMLLVWLPLVFIGGGAMLYATLKTQLKEGEMWREKAKRREETRRIEPARRGTIFSSDGKVLATTVPVCDLCLDLGRWTKTDAKGKEITKNGVPETESCITDTAAFFQSLPQVCKILHEQFPQKSLAYYHDRIVKEYQKEKPSRCLYVERRVPYSQWEAIRKLPGWNKCVVSRTSEGSVTSFIRAHIYGNLGENTIGLHFKTEKKEGYTGLEGYYDSILKGQDGEYICRRLTKGTWLPEDQGTTPDEDSTMTKRRIDGKSIIATIDTRYQDIAESSLRKSMRQYGGQSGCAILMEVSTGYILACSNLTIDSNGYPYEKLWSNVAVSDKYEPGSTFKTVAMISMFNDSKISIDTTKRVRAGGQKTYTATSGTINDGHGDAHDTANLVGVLAKSSNIGMCELAWEFYRKRRDDLKTGIENIFPFGRMNPDLEVIEPRTHVVKLNSDRDFLNLSYGYSATVTPLQLITFYNAIANGGKMVKPLFCREIINDNNRSKIQPVVLNNHICSEETAKQMREMLTKVVETGTGNNIRYAVYGIAGKTGTTEKIGDKNIKNSSFVGFFPANAPRYTCLVLIEGTSIAGRWAAAPVFRQIADCVVAFDKELGSIHLQDSGRAANPRVTKSDNDRLAIAHRLLGIPYQVVDTVQPATGWIFFDPEQQCYKNYSIPTNLVPDCTGMTIRDAMKLLRGMGFKVRFNGQGKVVRQTPKARTKAAQGDCITLELGIK